jgi:hypothetical protein
MDLDLQENERKTIEVVGRVTSILYSPIKGYPQFEICLEDKNYDTFTAQWVSLHKIPGIKIGTNIKLKGTISNQNIMPNPKYEIL